jgi:hypothetical protein
MVDCLEKFSGIPKFQMDWKKADWKIATGPEYTPAKRYVRTRTAIGKGNIPEDGKLFSQRMMATYDGDTLLSWNTELILPHGSSDELQEKLRDLCAFLQTNGILRIGKTAAPVGVTCEDRVKPKEITRSDYYRVTLQTPAWLIPTDLLVDGKGKPRSIGDTSALYAAYFSGHGGILHKHMALQTWSGGARAVGAKSARGGGYYPWLLTNVGSVFIVGGISPETLTQWQNTGLPLPKDSGKTWENCSFVPENGFGEVRIERCQVPSNVS